MTYSVLKVPLNPNQPTNRISLQHGRQILGALTACSSSLRIAATC